MTDNWYLVRAGQRTGPHTVEQLRQLAAGGGMTGLAAWSPAGTVKELHPPATTAAPAPPTPAPPPPPPPAPAEWYYLQNDQRQGPVTADRIRELQASGTLKPADLVWKNGMAG